MHPALIVLSVVGGVALIALVWFVATYNRLIRTRNHCDESWAGIDTELQRRYDLIPNLVETVRGYASHERETLDRVVEARARAMASTGDPGSQARDENDLVRSLRSMFAVAEAYPDLKASTNFLQLQNELVNTEDRIQRSRRFYNANVRELNTIIGVVPSNIVAGMFKFSPRQFFEIEDSSVAAPPRVSLGAK